MGRIDNSQFNIRSAFARKRARELAEESGMSVTQVVEEALRSYAPPPLERPPSDRLSRRGKLLVIKGDPNRRFTLDEINAGIEADRNRPLFPDEDA